MTFVVAHAEPLADEGGDPRAGPQRRGEAVRLGAGEQQLLELGELLGAQQRLAAGATGLAQGLGTLLAVLPDPLAHGLTGDLEPSRRLGLIQALFDQPDGFEAALFQRLEVSPHAFGISHDIKTYADY